MNKQEELYFAALSEDRANGAELMEKRFMRGLRTSVVDKYSDQAHFIYELLQNADDAQATTARFILEPSRLIFAHNGTRLFSVSDPVAEDADSETGKLGDINAITSIGNSTKTEASIGKFGIGFKAVFQYTSTPHIYDPNFRFKIERLIVPKQLDEDFPGRRSGETLFVFPFDHPERDAVEAYKDISDKLRNLSFPLLFLSGLKDIEFEFDDVIGLYGKSTKETFSFGNITAEHICLTQNNGDDLFDENLWLFSQSDDSRHRYSVGFLLDENGHLRPSHEPAFCFFPTKEVTGLNFIIHAPFLLTDNREGIRAGVVHNNNMVRHLAGLAASAIVHLKEIGMHEAFPLIDDNIIDIIPYDPDKFSSPDDKSTISFLPFYETIKEAFEKEEILPAAGGYAASGNAYWAAVPQLAQLFSNEQLGKVCDNDAARWVFPSLGRDAIQDANKALCKYIDSLVKTNLNDDAIISGRSRSSFYNRYLGEFQSLEPVKGITARFIEMQPSAWLHKFYHWLSGSTVRTKTVLRKPVFLDQDGKAAAAFDENDQLVLFLPVKGVTDNKNNPNAGKFSVVHPSLLDDPDTKKFIEEIGVRPPSLRDQIYIIILPQYQEEGGIDTDPHFALFFKYYCNNCMNGNDEEFIDLIKDYEFLTYYDAGDPQPYRDAASTMYLPTPELKTYFETKPETRFIAIDEYKNLVGASKEKQLISFLTELGVKKEPSAYEKRVDQYCYRESELYIDGLLELVDTIEQKRDIDLSVFLWNLLCSFADNKKLSFHVLNKTIGTRPDGRYNFKNTYKPSDTAIALKTKAWLVDSDRSFDSAENITRSKLSSLYSLDLEGAALLLQILDIGEDIADDIGEWEDDSRLTDSQRKKIEFADRFIAMGLEEIDEADLEELLRIKRQREFQRQASERGEDKEENDNSQMGGEDPDEAGFPDDSELSEDGRQRRKLSETTSKVVRDIARRTKETPSPVPADDTEEEEEADQDEYMPSVVDYSKRIERAKQKSAAEIDRIVYFEELQKRALTMPKYSYGWFKALLEMESLNSGEANSGSKEISISFAKVERDPGTKRTLVLKHPSRYIPQFMEDLADIPLVLHMGENKKTVAIEVVNIKSYTLRVKLKDGKEIDGIDLTAVNAATIDARSPAFLLEELRKQFAALGYADDFNMQDNLCENIEFIFGPPGTGKTTYLARNVLLPLMAENENCKILVLAPTNKAADVLVRRIMEVSSKNHSYNDWLVRFGATSDERIEQSPVFRDKTFDIRTLNKSVTITTIARFPYDFFMPHGTRIFLDGIKWDYIVIDEASMIPIANIVYPLYKKTPLKFIIAGDPFQIEPITSVDLWKNENIYTLVHLDSFVNPQTIPYRYKIELLTTQYRSIPEIGSIFSSFAYGGILKHHRFSESRRPLNLKEVLSVKALNLIKFPVSKYESIYRAKRLQHGSSYQIYSALFTYEYIRYLSKAIAGANPGSLFKIGVIAPYRAQADLIDKLLATGNTASGIDVQVGTIHSFQGDECDIIFSVLNPPPAISDSKDMFLNKRNIINVSISRARDYLFFIMPDDDTENISNLRLVKQVENLIKGSKAWTEELTPDLEALMFGDRNYLEGNAFSTSHQSVNVYSLPEKCYEVRTEDNAVDVQIHRGAQRAVSGRADTDKQVTQFTDGTVGGDKTENRIPKELRNGATEVHVTGTINGKYYLVPYIGKLKKYTDKRFVNMFIPQMRSGKKRLVSVSVVEEDKLLYISKDLFKAYEHSLTDSATIELMETNSR